MHTRIYNWLWFGSVISVMGILIVRGNDDRRGPNQQSSFFPSQLVHAFSPASELAIRCDTDPVYLGPGQSVKLRWALDSTVLKNKSLSMNLESENEETFDLGDLSQDSPTEATYRAPSRVQMETSLHVVATLLGSAVRPAACPIHLVTRREPMFPMDP